VKQPEEFIPDKRKKDGCGSWCRVCHSTFVKAKYRDDPLYRERHNAWVRKAKLLRTFGITVEQYDELWLAQDGRCDICKQTSEDWLSIDHDHETGEIRKLLCSGCNFGLGHFKDDTVRLAAAIEYLKRHAHGPELTDSKLPHSGTNQCPDVQ
jgi:hypothetical protein